MVSQYLPGETGSDWHGPFPRSRDGFLSSRMLRPPVHSAVLDSFSRIHTSMFEQWSGIIGTDTTNQRMLDRLFTKLSSPSSDHPRTLADLDPL
jgi:hypothetical protein